ncbi:MAG: acyl-CoA thioesterase [Spirochaetes bacterium]|nr:acyl-CoA thioesterase [Spirochaetota bacterium]
MSCVIYPHFSFCYYPCSCTLIVLILKQEAIKLENYIFSMEMTVRDYECDIQGIVNNSVYQNYLEHVRHEYLKHIGIDFKMYAQKGINLVVVRVELDYKFPLTSGDRFIVGLNMQRESKIKFAFYQDIYRLPDNKPVIKGKTIGVALNLRGRPHIPEEFEKIFGPFKVK